MCSQELEVGYLNGNLGSTCWDSGAIQQGSCTVSAERDPLRGACGTDWRLEKLESGRKPDAKSGKPGCAEDLGHTHGSGKGGNAKVSDNVKENQHD